MRQVERQRDDERAQDASARQSRGDGLHSRERRNRTASQQRDEQHARDHEQCERSHVHAQHREDTEQEALGRHALRIETDGHQPIRGADQREDRPDFRFEANGARGHEGRGDQNQHPHECGGDAQLHRAQQQVLTDRRAWVGQPEDEPANQLSLRQQHGPQEKQFTTERDDVLPVVVRGKWEDALVLDPIDDPRRVIHLLVASMNRRRDLRDRRQRQHRDDENQCRCAPRRKSRHECARARTGDGATTRRLVEQSAHAIRRRTRRMIAQMRSWAAIQAAGCNWRIDDVRPAITPS